jgi:uncharacterized short protein YbdD (DUF466 family)
VSPPGRPLADRLRAHVRVLREGWLQMVGIPDYERYLAHRAAHHPQEDVLSRRAFFAQAIDRKYGRSGPRCC